MAQKSIQAVEGTGLQGGCRGIGQMQSEVDKAAHERADSEGCAEAEGCSRSIQKRISNGGGAAECKCEAGQAGRVGGQERASGQEWRGKARGRIDSKSRSRTAAPAPADAADAAGQARYGWFGWAVWRAAGGRAI